MSLKFAKENRLKAFVLVQLLILNSASSITGDGKLGLSRQHWIFSYTSTDLRLSQRRPDDLMSLPVIVFKKPGFKYILHVKLLIWFLPIPGTQTHTGFIRRALLFFFFFFCTLRLSL